ncbi:MAG: ATP-dependent Clp protease proteolytic subunit [Flavobacteriales bacterium]|nr:ATP-dependent Clp protease proteolytic subunit [Flavobacteriales bacterium]
MKKRPLRITAQANGRRADIRIDGMIASFRETNAKEFERSIAELKAQGIADAHLYIDSEGGSVLEAKRIVASVRAFGGRVTGEGGAMVASAATYIGAHLDEFKLQKYTAYMIHKPETEVRGNEDVVASDLKALGDITKEYRAAYAKRSGKTEDEIEAIWSKGEQWYTGEEAVAQGFVDGLVDDYTESVDEETLARMAACGCPKDKLPKQAQHEHNNDRMNIEAMRASLGMPNTATEAEVLARVNELKTANDRHVATAKELRTNEVKSILDKAVAERKLTEAHRASYEQKFAAAFDATKAEVESLTAAPEMAKEVQAGAATTATKQAVRDAWKYEDWADKDNAGLRGMMTTDPDKFSALYEDRYGRKPELPNA